MNIKKEGKKSRSWMSLKSREERFLNLGRCFKLHLDRLNPTVCFIFVHFQYISVKLFQFGRNETITKCSAFGRLPMDGKTKIDAKCYSHLQFWRAGNQSIKYQKKYKYPPSNATGWTFSLFTFFRLPIRSNPQCDSPMISKLICCNTGWQVSDKIRWELVVILYKF